MSQTNAIIMTLLHNKKRDEDVQLFCNWMFINAHVCSYIWFYAFLSGCTSEHCLWGILSNIKEKKHSISALPLPPSPLNPSHCRRCSLSEHSMSWEEVRGQEKLSGVMTTWCHQPKIWVAGGTTGKVGQHVTAYCLSTQITEFNTDPERIK